MISLKLTGKLRDALNNDTKSCQRPHRRTKGAERGLGIGFGLGHPDLVQCPLGLGLQALRQLVQDVRRLVHPAALATGCGPHLLDRLPEAERTVGDRQLRSHGEPAPPEVEQQVAPGLRALAHAVDQADQLLPAFRRRADDDEQALGVVLEPGLHMDAVGPEIDVAPGRQVALAPMGVLVRPGVLEPRDGRRRQPAGVRAEQGRQRLGEIAGGDALEVEDGDQRLQALRAPRKGRIT